MARDSGKGITYPMRACSQAFARMRCAIFIDFKAASEAHFCSPCSMAPAASLNVLLAFATCSGLAASVRPPSLCCSMMQEMPAGTSGNLKQPGVLITQQG